MANKEGDELDRDPQADEETRGLEDDDFEEGDEADDLYDDELDADARLTEEAGSEGGSPGETVVTRRRGERVGGSEAGETWSPEQDRTRSVERLGEEGQPRKRNP